MFNFCSIQVFIISSAIALSCNENTTRAASSASVNADFFVAIGNAYLIELFVKLHLQPELFLPDDAQYKAMPIRINALFEKGAIDIPVPNIFKPIVGSNG